MVGLAHPLWLFALIPWAAVVIDLLTGRPRRVIIPFLDLWPTSQGAARQHYFWRIPQPAVMAALAAALAAIVAAAGPYVAPRVGSSVAAGSPAGVPGGVEISELSVRTLAGGKACAMVRLVNHSDLRQIALRVTGAEALTVALPASGGAANYFVDLQSSPPVVEASVGAGEAVEAIRSPAWPKVVPTCLLPMELQRMVDVYARDRAPGAQPRIVAVTAIDAEALDRPAALVMAAAMSGVTASGPVQVAPDPLTEGIDWNAALEGGEVAAAQPQGQWQRLVWQGDRTLVARRIGRPLQIWAGFRGSDWARSAEFVVFWSRVFDELGEGGDVYRAQISSSEEPAVLPVAAIRNDRAGWMAAAAVVCLLIAAVLIPRGGGIRWSHGGN